MRNVVVAIFSALLLAALAGCASMGSAVFLLDKVDDEGKSRALTEQGVARYEYEILGRRDYSSFEEVKKYFVVALRYDPSNARAREYIELMERHRETVLRDNMAGAGRLLEKTKRSEEETYALLLMIEQACTLDPENGEALELKTRTEDLRTSLVKAYYGRAAAEREKAGAGDSREKREAACLAAVDYLDMAGSIDPDSGRVRSARREAGAELEDLFRERAEETRKQITEGRHGDAKRGIARLSVMNRRLGYAHRDEIKALNSELELAVATPPGGPGGSDGASGKGAMPAPGKKQGGAPGERGKGKTAKTKQPQGPSSEEAVAQIEELIERGDIGAAHRLLQSRLKVETDGGTRQRLAILQGEIDGRVAEAYRKGIERYRQEDFKGAVALLETVVSVDPGYELASDYLEKARSKRRLLEGYEKSE